MLARRPLELPGRAPALREPQVRVPAERNWYCGVARWLHHGAQRKAGCGVEARVDRDRVRERERAQLVGMRAVVEARHEVLVSLIDDVERGTEQIAVDRQAVVVARQ